MTSSANAIRPDLRLVRGALEVPVQWSWFCGHCAAPAPGGEAPAPTARVCGSCGLGLLLETRQDAAPDPADAFLIVDGSMHVHGLSRNAERLLGLREDAVVNRPLSELLVPADAEAGRPSSLAAAVAEAVASGLEPLHAFVRPANTFGVRVRARITACGPPRAALIVLDSQPPRLRAV
jgi:PAS domain-containing protein